MLYYINTSVLPFFLNICRVDDYGIKNKLAFEVAYAGYRNQRESLRFVQLQPPVVAVKQDQNEIVNKAASDVVQMTPTTVQKNKKNKNKKRKYCSRKDVIEKQAQQKKPQNF